MSPARGAAHPFWSVRARLRRQFVLVVVLVLATGVTGIVAVLAVERAMERLVERDAPATAANASVLQAMTNAESGERGFLITGDEVSLAPYVTGRAALVESLAETRRLAAGDEAILAALAEEEERSSLWLDRFAEPVIALRRTDPPAALAFASGGEGRRRFDSFRRANATTAELLVARQDANRVAAERVEARAVAAVTVLVLLGTVLGGLLALRTTRAVTRPLTAVRGTLEQLARGDLTQRAAVTGPGEIRAVARSVNHLAATSEALMATRREVEATQRAALVREREVVEHLRELDRTRQELVSCVSHELRTPLTSITGYLDLLAEEDSGPLNEEQRRILSVVDRNTGRLLALVEDILTLSSVETGSFQLQLSPTDLAPVVASVRSAQMPAAVARGVSLTCHVDDHLTLVAGDVDQLERMLGNLVSNAVKFTSAGGQVAVVVSSAGGAVELVVSDTGMGIPADEQERLFSPFFRASAATRLQVPGTGLGLAIVHTIVERHGGTLVLSSVEGQGTTVRVSLPARHLAEVDVDALDAPELRAGS